jgi:hypothetical protein
MPGALDVLVEIQFSADDSVLKEINSQLEKESNILKTVEERLKQLNAAASGQQVIGQQLKLVNKEIEQTNRLLVKMQSSYREVDHLSASLQRQNTVWSSLALAIGKAPDATSKFKAGVMDLVGAIPQLGDKIQDLQGKNTTLIGTSGNLKNVIGGLAKSFMSTGNIASIAAVGISFLVDKIFEESEAAQQAAKDNDEFVASIKRIRDASHRKTLEETNDLQHYYFMAQNINAGTTKQVEAVKWLQKNYPGSFGKEKPENIMTGKSDAAYQRTKESVDNKNNAERAGKSQVDAQAKRDEYAPKINKLDEEYNKLLEKRNKAAKEQDWTEYRDLSNKINKNRIEYAPLYKEYDKYNTAANKYRDERIQYESDTEDLTTPPEPTNTDKPAYTPKATPENKSILEELRRMHHNLEKENERYQKEKEKEEEKSGERSKEIITKNAVAARDAEIAEFNALMAEKQKMRGKFSADELAMMDRIRKEIDTKYYHESLEELEEYGKEVAALHEEMSEAITGSKSKLNEEQNGQALGYKLGKVEDSRLKQRGDVSKKYEGLRKEAVRLHEDKPGKLKELEQAEQDELLAIEIDAAQKRLDVQIKFYDDREKLIRERTNTMLTEADTEAQQQLRKTKNPRNKAVLKTQSGMAQNLLQQNGLQAELAEAEKAKATVYANPYASKEQVSEADANVAKIINQIETLKSAYQDMNAELAKQKVARVTGAFEDVNAGIQQIGGAVDAFMAGEQAKTEALIAEQEKRVERAKEFAEDGNTAMLEAEQERLEALEKKHREYAEKRKAINTILVASQQAVNVAQAIGAIVAAAAEGDPYTLAARVIAAVAALVAGVAAVSGAMKEGGDGYAEGGYTGDGARLAPAGTVHRGEYVMPQETVKRYGIEALEAIHYGRIPADVLTGKMMSVNYAGMLQTHHQARSGNNYDMRRLESKFDMLLEAYNNNGGTQLNIDENGIVAIYNEHVKNKTRINKLR